MGYDVCGTDAALGGGCVSVGAEHVWTYARVRATCCTRQCLRFWADAFAELKSHRHKVVQALRRWQQRSLAAVIDQWCEKCRLQRNSTTPTTLYPTSQPPYTPHLTHTLFYRPQLTHAVAQDFAGDSPIMRRGPTTTLPPHENQIVIWNYGLGVQHIMFADTTTTPPRIINCSRVKSGTQSGTAMRESWAGYLSYPQTQQRTAPSSCKGCEQWNYVQSGSTPCPSPSPPQTMNETLVYLLGPAVPTEGAAAVVAVAAVHDGANAGSARPILNLTNVIHQQLCAGTAPVPTMWATSDWQQGFVSPADPTLFAVPADADCPMVAASEAPPVVVSTAGPLGLARAV